MVCLNPLAIRIAAATGNVIKDETSKIPTIRMEDAITRATNTIKITSNTLAFRPETFAYSSSNDSRNNSLYKDKINDKYNNRGNDNRNHISAANGTNTTK